MRARSLRVVKLGGSWLERPGYAEELKAWLAQETTACSCILVGGGKPVDAIRQLAEINRYDDHCLHWLCIDMMALSLRLVADQLPDWPLLNNTQQLRAWVEARQPGNALVSVHAFYGQPGRAPDGFERSTSSNAKRRTSQPNAQPEFSLAEQLPIGWATTSDSLAAYLANQLSADELVLLKSCRLPVDDDGNTLQQWTRLARMGIVDHAFPRAARGLNVRMVSPESLRGHS